MGYKRMSIILIAMMLFAFSATASGENIDPDNDGSQYAWGENVGWINMEPAFGPGVTVTDSAMTGMAWGENIGWINLSPANGGVVNDGNGNLSGYAWSENVGWINFNPAGGGVWIDSNGVFSGQAWGENIGWINFVPSTGGVKTSWKGIADADADGDGYTASEDCDDSDPDVHPGAAEICNGIDDNCSGFVDENLTRTTICGAGACAGNTGIEICAEGVWGNNTCDPLAGSSAEACDGNDNDCNGIADDGIASIPTTCGKGVCASSGQLICESGALRDTCAAGAPTGDDNNCNGVDENCNGIADDGYVPTVTTCGVGVCAAAGQNICQDGAIINTCTAGQPQAEICNGMDDDCDGYADENYVFGGFQQPINADGSSIFKAGSTIPVKIILNNCSGQSTSTATVTIAVNKILNVISGTEVELLVDSSGNANTGNLFRYDATAGQYIFNLSTKGYTAGTYRVYAKPDDGSSYSVNFSLK